MSVFEVPIGEKQYRCRRINLATMEQHEEFFRRVTMARKGQGPLLDEMSVKDFIEIAQIIHECIRRVQPEVTLQDIKDELDPEAAGAVFGMVMSGSGFVSTGEPKPANSQT